MANQSATAYKQKGYLGSALVTLGLAAMLGELSILVQPLQLLVGRFQEGPLGILATLGSFILDATHAIAFHQFSTIGLASRILVLFSGAVAMLIGASLLHGERTRAASYDEERLLDANWGGR